MNYKHNKKYFSATVLSKLAIVCWVLTAIGAAILFFQIWDLWFIGGGIGVVSCVLGFVFTSFSMKDSEYDEICASLSEKFKERFIAFVNEYINKGNLHNKVVESVDTGKISFSQSFILDDGALVKRGSDEHFRSSVIAFTALMPDKNTLYIGHELFGLTEEKHRELFGAYPYRDIESIESFTPETQSSLAEYAFIRIKINGKDGVIEFPKANDAELSKLVELISSRIKQAKNV